MSTTPTPRLDIQLFPQEMIDLNREIANHPELITILSQQKTKDVYIRLCEIATYCEILVIGDFTQQDILNLARKLTNKLYAMRTSIILPMH